MTTTAGDLLTEDGCPECDASVVRVSGEASLKGEVEFECRNGHVWTEGWRCPHCGSTEPHHAIEFPQEDDPRFAELDMEVEPEIEVDVTCQSVYITSIDGGDGFAFTHNEFEKIIEHYGESDFTK